MPLTQSPRPLSPRSALTTTQDILQIRRADGACETCTIANLGIDRDAQDLESHVEIVIDRDILLGRTAFICHQREFQHILVKGVYTLMRSLMMT